MFITQEDRACNNARPQTSKIPNRRFNFASFYPYKEFLSRVEKSRGNSLKMQLSRKLAGTLEPHVAYKFLASTSLIKEISSVKSKTFIISLQPNIELKSMEHRLIPEQVRSVYGNHINSLDFSILKSNKDIRQSSNQPQLLTKTASISCQGVWGKIRQSLIDYYGFNGLGLDNTDFSKLTAEEDASNKRLTLKASSKFIKNQIQSNCLQLINKICLKENYQLTGVFV